MEQIDTSTPEGLATASCLMDAAETLLGLGDDYPNSPEARKEIKALENKVRRRYKVKTSLKGIDPEVARRVINALDELFTQYPKMKSYFRCLSTLTNRSVRQDDSVILRDAKVDATWDWNTMMTCTSTVEGDFYFGICINPSNFRKMEMSQRMLDAMERNGIMPKGCNSVEALVAHEFGHAVLQVAMRKMNKLAIRELERAMTAGTLHDSLLNWQLMGENDAEEIWADTFAAIHRAPPETLKDSMLAKTVRDNMKNYRYLYE